MAVLEKNQLHTVTIDGYSSEAMGVCRIDRQAVFVHGGVRGDVCEIRILKAGARMSWARIERLLTPSPYRAEPDCAAYPACGGCNCRHMSYDEELFFKKTHVEQTLTRLGGVSLTAGEVLEAPGRDCGRNKALLPVTRVNGRAKTGFFRARSRQVVPADICLSALPQINACAQATRGFLDKTGISVYNPETGEGLVRHLFVRTTRNGTQAALVINGSELPHSNLWISGIRENCSDVIGVLTIENRRDDNVVLGDGPVRVLWGDETLIETLGCYDFEVHPLAFAQVHSSQAARLYECVLAYAGRGRCAVDLYCGTGTLTLWLSKSFGSVRGVEIVPWAAECARRNAARNSADNVVFYQGDAGALAAEAALGKPDVVTVDPPRTGLDMRAVETVTALSPERLVYVSCDPGTLARDIKRFAERGYGAKRLTIVDMFPGTRHVESVVLMERE